MVAILPFKGIRPEAALADKVAALPYDVVDTEEAAQLAAGNPYSYFHIDKAEIDLPGISSYDPQVYQKAADNLAAFLQKEWLIQDQVPSYYLYELTMNGRSQTGFVACTSIDDYVRGKIKKHELTRPEKEQDRIQHILACDANTSPIFLSYRQPERIAAIVKNWQAAHLPLYDFSSYHDVHHRVWRIDDASVVAKLSDAFQEVEALYIADGHHRTESAVKVGLQKREEGKQTAESDRFLSIIFPENELAIWEYNRVINAPIPKDFWAQLAENFVIKKTEQAKPHEKGTLHLYLDQQWFSLTIKPEKVPEDIVGSLDVSLAQSYIFKPIFEIEDVRTDKRIDFVGGIRGTDELVRLVDSGKWQIAFSMFPPTMTELLAVADADEMMPPKSTWFEPKLLSGLFLHDLETT